MATAEFDLGQEFEADMLSGVAQSGNVQEAIPWLLLLLCDIRTSRVVIVVLDVFFVYH